MCIFPFSFFPPSSPPQPSLLRSLAMKQLDDCRSVICANHICRWAWNSLLIFRYQTSCTEKPAKTRFGGKKARSASLRESLEARFTFYIFHKMYDQVKTSPAICDNNANFFVRKRTKILSKSKVAQVFSFFFFPPSSGLTPSAYWRFDFFHIFFFPREVTQACGVKDGERYVCHEAREHVSP